FHVTGVQTCALPIYPAGTSRYLNHILAVGTCVCCNGNWNSCGLGISTLGVNLSIVAECQCTIVGDAQESNRMRFECGHLTIVGRSEERRVGKGGRLW